MILQGLATVKLDSAVRPSVRPPPGRRVDFLEAGKSRFLENPEFWDLAIWKFGIQKIGKIKILKIQIRFTQNVGKVWISRKKSSRPYLGPSEAIFSIDRKIKKNEKKKMHIFLGGSMGPYSPGLGPCCYPPEVGE